MVKNKNASSPITEVKSQKLRLKIKLSCPNSDSMFLKGTNVEVRSDEKGYEGAWYAALIVGYMGENKYLVQYFNLVTDDGAEPLQEVAKLQDIRPLPPMFRSLVRFNMLERVDAWYNEGWWEGTVWKVLEGFKYNIYFRFTNETLVMAHSNLRPHLEWIDGEWIKEKSVIFNRNPKACFNRGEKVEVRSDEVGFEGAWFVATIVDKIESEKFLVQYQNLLADNRADYLREEANISDIRPLPPRIHRVHPFELFETVDAWYNDGWWVGCVIEVHRNLNYTVRFNTREELEFEHCQIRPYQEWVDGNWISFQGIDPNQVHFR